MKFGKVLGALILLCALLAIFFIVEIIPSKITGDKAEKLFNQAGGVARINQESKILFTQYEAITNGSKFFRESELKNSPAISSLGSHIFLTRDSPDDPPMIGILAVHTPNQWFCIFPVDFDLSKITRFQNMPDLKMTLLDRSKSFQITSNIFFLK